MRKLETVLFEVGEDHVATITLDRPEVMNSFNEPMLDDFAAIWKRCRQDDEIHAVVLRANGERAFSTGVDRKSGRFRHPNPWSEDDPGVFLGAKQNRVWKPLICAVHGMAAGGAFYWLNEADVIICSDDATFFDPHTTYGMTSALEPVGLLKRIPLGEVLRIALFGLDERVSPQRALQIGLVSEVVPRAELWDRAHTLAVRLAEKPALAIQGTVKAIWDSLEMSPHGGREVPLVYTQLANPLTKLEFTPGKSPPYEVR
jgi:enoyl-CoA hydratase/carnithine racemase